MKMNKKIFASSAVAALALVGTLAPATGVFAATSSIDGAQDIKLNSADQLGNGEQADSLVGVYAQSGATTGEAVAKSAAQVGIISDVLSLDAVPDFNFGNAVPGKTVNLHNNVATSQDGNSRGLLQITDSRTTKATDASGEATILYGGGYNLSLSVGAFTNAESNNAAASTDATATSDAVKNGFRLEFGKDALNGNGGVWAASKDGASAEIANSTFTSDGTTANFVTSATTDGASYGRVKAYLNGDHADDIQLFVPDGADGGYTSTLTWTLTPTVVTPQA
ncbi:WxL domain-containing protein [Agrilactobacillus yilanensis]|uniref:WxL domain-containing protein n=1 Tax=Agrilactobacillus yilanensis TaxID=2485997 RepID=A0ABW4J626_9LACO|nr:WxL domain-containing protein [Agrilactobacillus yilanensis]